MKKYGLQLRVPPVQKKQPAVRPPLPTASIFREDDDNDVEREISRQASKNKSLKDIEEQHKQALEQDPSVFAYDEVYDDMKQKAVLPRMQEREERKPRYIQHLIKKAEQRQKEQEIVYERKLAKERSKDEHLYADKDKFITSAYRKKLEEQQRWMAEERLRELREEKEDVTKKKDLSDFYFNLGKNVAFGATEAEAREAERLEKLKKAEKLKESREAESREEKKSEIPERDRSHESLATRRESSTSKELPSSSSRTGVDPQDSKEASEDVKIPDVSEKEDSSAKEPAKDHHKRSQDAIAAAKERFLARKKAKV